MTIVEAPPTERLKPLDDYDAEGAAGPAPRGGLPVRAAPLIAGPGGTLVEYDLDDTGDLVPVDRPRGQNKAGILVGVVTTPTDAAPRGHHPGGALR